MLCIIYIYICLYTHTINYVSLSLYIYIHILRASLSLGALGIQNAHETMLTRCARRRTRGDAHCIV